MASRSSKIRKASCVLALLATMASVALANQSVGLPSTSPTPFCYCNCKQQDGVMMCTKMCELPKYQNRWWAHSCQTRNFPVQQAKPEGGNSKSPKTNHREDARNSSEPRGANANKTS
jgi:hypothetical protein